MDEVGQKESGGGDQKIASAPLQTTRNLILTIIIAITPIICALWYQHSQITRQENKIELYQQLLEELNNKKNLTKQEAEIKKDIEQELEEPPNNSTNNNIKPSFGKKPWHRGSNTRRKTR
jgi:hypothetical protein